MIGVDLFCKVVDNFGDAGVMWRLARALVHEHGAVVRLWIDRPATLAAIAPEEDAAIERREWGTAFPEIVPHEIVVEGFGCGLPEAFVAAMAARQPNSAWIVLEYLSAEPWVGEFHARPSPHPRFALERTFFFPGFEPASGGLLRERDLFARRECFGAAERARLFADLGVAPPPAHVTTVLMFAYDDAPLEALADALAEAPTLMLVPGRPAPAARGLLTTARIPFVPQSRFDELLWACDINFVRGEDSFVRAQWAARAFVWQIYAQPERAHWVKLEAFLDRFDAGTAMRDLWHAWNRIDGAPPLVAAWREFVAQRVAIDRQVRAWGDRLAQSEDLATKLLKLARERVKS